ncbi:hypothetical protein E3P86_00095 [Wallemia ichthyophaga]|uniref:RNA 3'-terminal phosphate cyclase-like protein n=1 Tax=Wallemia ichthyophaga TaxID=245174 RepID=A0A4T0JLG1_WALIC|nr:hypothetical protein E3P86_00095 [Wallemia ichthyophaga]
MPNNLINFHSHIHLRQRLIISTLLSKPIRIDSIRSNHSNPGITDYEAGFLRLLEKLTNGSKVEISYTGTSILYQPGSLTGGNISHSCSSKSIGWFLEFILVLAPFLKHPLNLTLHGITSDPNDISVDSLRTVSLPHLSLFGISDGLELNIKKRGSPPLGGGTVIFKCPTLRQIKSLNFLDPGKIKRIRGIAHSVRVSPQLANRMVDASRGLLNRYIPDIYLYTDIYRGDEAGKSPGYALTLVAESTTGALHSAEAVSLPGTTPEDVATRASSALLEEIANKGAIDSSHQWLVLLLMSLGSEDVGRCRMGSLTPHSIQFLRDLHQSMGVAFKIKQLEQSNEVIASCVGIGYTGQRKVA